MPMKNSTFMRGIGRAVTERYSSLKRLLTVPLSVVGPFQGESLVEREVVHQVGRQPAAEVMSLLDMVSASL